MLFNQLKNGDAIHIIEVLGTFKKNIEYNTGIITMISKPYDEPIPQNQFNIPSQQRRKVIDINIQSNGETKKFTVPEDRSTITDSQLGLTISTDKEEIINIIRNQYNIYKARKESIARCDEEMDKCKAILERLNITNPPKEDSTIKQMQEQIKHLTDIINKQSDKQKEMVSQ